MVVQTKHNKKNRYPSLIFLALPLLAVAGSRDANSTVGGNTTLTLCLTSEELIAAFSDVFAAQDLIIDARSPVIMTALRQLDQLGVRFPIGVDPSCAVPITLQSGMAPSSVAGVLMRAALGNLLLGLRDPSDWSIVVADPMSGRLTRSRSFSSVRFAVLEGLLVLTILALGRALWLDQHDGRQDEHAERPS